MVAWGYEISLLVLKKIFQHSKRNFVPPRGHVISSIYVALLHLGIFNDTDF